MGLVRGMERAARRSGTVGNFEKYRKGHRQVRTLAENNKDILLFSEDFRLQTFLIGCEGSLWLNSDSLEH